MKNQNKAKKFKLAICATLFSVIAATDSNAQNIFPLAGSAGINTTTPQADLQIIHNQGVICPGPSMYTIQPAIRIDEYRYEPGISYPRWNAFEIRYAPGPCDASIPPGPVVFAVSTGDGGTTVAINKPTAFAILDVGGDANVDGPLTTGGNANIGADANIAGNTIMSGNLDVNGSGGLNINGLGVLTVNGGSLGIVDYQNLWVGGNAEVVGNTDMLGTLLVFGDITSYSDVICDKSYANSFIITSDASFKKDITSLVSAKEKLFQIEPHQYKYNKEAFPKKHFDDLTHFGFIAQEVQNVYPNLAVKIDSEGHLGVNYTEFIPLLLQSIKDQDQTIKEMQVQIADMKTQLANIEKVKDGNLGTGNNEDVKNKSELAQNAPNPFNKETVIKYNIVGNYTKAYIGIYDLNGKELQKASIQPNSNQIIFQAGALASGMYVYSLIVDSKIIDSKRMAIE